MWGWVGEIFKALFGFWSGERRHRKELEAREDLGAQKQTDAARTKEMDNVQKAGAADDALTTDAASVLGDALNTFQPDSGNGKQ